MKQSTNTITIKSTPAEESSTEVKSTISLTLDIPIPEGRTEEDVKAAIIGLDLEEVFLDADETVKVGRRNSTQDANRIQSIHDHALALGAKSPGYGDAPKDGDKKDPKATAKPIAKKSVKADVEGEEASDQAEALGLPLDTLVSAVREAFWDIRDTMRQAQRPFGQNEDGYWSWDDDEVPSCIAVYDGFAIARVQLATYKVPYEVENAGIVLAPQSEWIQVTQDWVVKSLGADFIKTYMHKREVGSVKALGESRLGNYLVVWGDEKRRDLTGEFFDKEKTLGLKAIFDVIGKVPALYQHAMDGAAKYTPVGVIDTMVPDDIGLWTETQLDMANKYAVEMQKLARRKALGASSGTLPGARKVESNGLISQWPIIEGSFTPTPAEPRLRELGVAEVKSIYQESGLTLPDDIEAQYSRGGEEPRQGEAEKSTELEELRLLELSIIE
jgi:hypothetical protein